MLAITSFGKAPASSVGMRISSAHQGRTWDRIRTAPERNLLAHLHGSPRPRGSPNRLPGRPAPLPFTADWVRITGRFRGADASSQRVALLPKFTVTV